MVGLSLDEVLCQEQRQLELCIRAIGADISETAGLHCFTFRVSRLCVLQHMDGLSPPTEGDDERATLLFSGPVDTSRVYTGEGEFDHSQSTQELLEIIIQVPRVQSLSAVGPPCVPVFVFNMSGMAGVWGRETVEWMEQLFEGK